MVYREYLISVTSFGHRLIKEYIGQKPGEQYRSIGPLVHYDVRWAFRPMGLLFV